VSVTPSPPEYAEEFLADLDPAALVALLVRDEDRVPRNLIDACARHGERMVVELRRVLDEGRPWKDEGSAGEWWLTLHAAMILGLMPGEQAGLLLVAFMRRIALEDDEDMQDWLSGYWPALFRNKPDSILPALRALVSDRGCDWYIRTNALEALIAAGERAGTDPLGEALAYAAGIAADETENWELRLSAGNTLLDFAPAVHRPLLENLAERQTGLGAWFSNTDLEKAYSAKKCAPQWHRMSDPWEFYRPGFIARRQDRWAKEAEKEEEDDFDFAGPDVEPYVRGRPKVGRNDPCPCGSGKKYKKCCLTKARK
jgi:hypothetical protein